MLAESGRETEREPADDVHAWLDTDDVPSEASSSSLMYDAVPGTCSHQPSRAVSICERLFLLPGTVILLPGTLILLPKTLITRDPYYGSRGVEIGSRGVEIGHGTHGTATTHATRVHRPLAR